VRKVFFLISGCFIFVLCFNGRRTRVPYQFPESKFFPEMPVSLENPVTVEGASLGRFLFYDPILSSDSSISCASCHKQKFAFSDSPNQFSKGRNGALMKRNTMALFNLAWYPSFFWDGKAPTLEGQIFHPIKATDEMNMQVNIAVERLNKNPFYKQKFKTVFDEEGIDSVRIAKAIAQFLRTLISTQSKFDKVENGIGNFTDDEYEGFYLMNDQTKGDCLHCHTTDANTLGTTLTFSNNGLDAVFNPQDYKDKGRGTVTAKVSDNGKFMIPSLRNISLTAPYMHDGRFKTLEEVLEFYSSGVNQCSNIDSKMEFAHQGGAHLTNAEKKKIISFLLTLTDSTFITNPEFSNPYPAYGR
jgi:cytochrome c peroxidase